ncbi:MAG: NAD-binding protein [Gammaproteobacteria bacterium]|nr:NAD-binding protein [Gammaproteobacteria bacterium]
MKKDMKRRKVLLFGCNSLVNEVSRQLTSREWDISIVSQDEECIKRLDAKKITFKDVDYTDDKQLKSLGIGNDVDTVFSFFEEDAKNVYLIISAKDIDPDVLIITLSQSPDSSDKLRAAGADKVIDPYEISGRKIFNMIKKPLISETIEHVVFGQSSINLAEIEIKADSFLDGQSLGEAQLSQNYNLILLGVVDRELGNEFIFRLSGIDHKLDPSDLLVVIGAADEIQRLKTDISCQQKNN